VEGDLVTLTGEEGTVEIQAFQQGNAVFLEAVTVNSFQVVENPNTNVNDLWNNKQVRIYPNPVKDKLYVKNLQSEQKAVGLTISDITGNIITIDFANDLNNGEMEINVSQLSEGIYILKWDNGHTFRFVKIK
jgi:hypothetical protein